MLDFLLRSHNSCVIPYLEHVVHTWEDNNPLFHNALIHQYREKVLSNGPSGQHTRKKLLDFLDKSVHYTPDTVLSHFPTDDLLEERAIIIGRLGRHDQALAIYVQALGDYEKATEYCKKVWESKSINSQDVSRFFLKPPLSRFLILILIRELDLIACLIVITQLVLGIEINIAVPRRCTFVNPFCTYIST